MEEKKEPNVCPICGKPSERKYCSKECYHESLRRKSSTSTEKLTALDNTNRCWQCGKPMPINRYSAYCEECEMYTIYTVGESDLTDDSEK